MALLRRRARLAILSAAALASLGLAASRHLGRATERRSGEALAELSACLLGKPIDEVAEPERLLRSIQIGASLDPAKHESWPKRCEGRAVELHRLATGLRAERMAKLGGAECGDDARCGSASTLLLEADNVASFTRTGRLGALDLGRLRQAAARLGLPKRDASAEVAVPEPASLFDPRTMTPLYRGDYLRLLTDPPGDDDLDLLFYEHERRYGLCGVDLRREDRARCRLLAGPIPVGFAGELLAGEPGAPMLLYAQGPGTNGWVEGLFDVSDGAFLARLDERPSGGFVWRDGSFARLAITNRGAELQLVRRDPQGLESTERTELGDSLSVPPRLQWDEVVWAVAKEGGQHALFAQRVTPPGQPLGPIVPLGQVGPLKTVPTVDFCRTDEALVLLVGEIRAERGGAAALFFRTTEGTEQHWHPPHLLQVASAHTGFTCEGAEATLSWIGGQDDWLPAEQAPALDGEEPRPVQGRYRVHRLRCGPRACTHRKAVVGLQRYSYDSRYVAGDLGSSMVVLWRSPLGDVRMRVAPLDALSAAPEVPLFDDVDHDGFGWDLERHPIFGRGEAMVVLLGTPTEEQDEPMTYGLRIDAKGRASPMVVADR